VGAHEAAKKDSIVSGDAGLALIVEEKDQDLGDS